VVVALAPAAAVRAEERLAAGAKDLGLGGVVSFSLPKNDLDEVTTFQLLPHVGYVVTDPGGPGLLRGSLEALLEPALIHLTDGTNSSTVVGASALARWIFATAGRFRPYFEVGAGVLLGETDLQQTDCDVNFLLQGGPGVLVFLTDRSLLTVGYRFQHVSNGGTCAFNVGINSSALYLGASYLLP
jgi:opacity protein-like surface antigen